MRDGWVAVGMGSMGGIRTGGSEEVTLYMVHGIVKASSAERLAEAAAESVPKYLHRYVLKGCMRNIVGP